MIFYNNVAECLNVSGYALIQIPDALFFLFGLLKRIVHKDKRLQHLFKISKNDFNSDPESSIASVLDHDSSLNQDDKEMKGKITCKCRITARPDIFEVMKKEISALQKRVEKTDRKVELLKTEVRQ